jgi:hypothetical protein
VSCNNAWYDWGRWVALALVIGGFILIFFLFSCISARRRRRRGAQPYYGTGWVGRTPWGHGAATYNPQYGRQQEQPYQGYQQGGYYGQQNAPPAYQPNPQTGGYFGGARSETPSNGVYEMQPPNRVYQGNPPEVSGAKN